MDIEMRPQTELEEIRITKEGDADLYHELMGVLPELLDSKADLAALTYEYIREAKSRRDALDKRFREIVAREGWGGDEQTDRIRIETYQITAQTSAGHDVGPSVRVTTRRVG